MPTHGEFRAWALAHGYTAETRAPTTKENAMALRGHIRDLPAKYPVPQLTSRSSS
jgi:hypothetical protein